MRHVTTALELAGYGVVTAAAWLVDMRLGLLALGVALVLVAYGLGKARS